MILLCNDMRIIRYQLKLRVYTQEVMLINSTVFAVERLTKFITNRRFSFASLFLRVFLVLPARYLTVITIPELNKIKNCCRMKMEFSYFRPILVYKITSDIKMKSKNGFSRCGELYIGRLQKEGRFSTAHVYKNALFSFSKFCGTQSVSFRQVTRECLRRYGQHLSESGLKPNTVSTYMRMLRSVYNRGVESGRAP